MNCPRCGNIAKHRDWTNRVVKYGDGNKEVIRIERCICKTCNYIFRILPDYVVPYKHYNKKIITKVLDKEIDENTIGYEDYPCAMTMKRWASKN